MTQLMATRVSAREALCHAILKAERRLLALKALKRNVNWDALDDDEEEAIWEMMWVLHDK